jgi:diadenosine tetraphosphate (Ap4A) HIT family hydrolase
MDAECLLCRPDEADPFFRRVRVWEDDLWRLAVAVEGPVLGFAHLEPKRHIPFITDLDGPEAATLGEVLARVTSALKQAAGAELAFVYVLGERVQHLHFNIAPHRTGDALQGGPELLKPGSIGLAEADLRACAERVRQVLRVDR